MLKGILPIVFAASAVMGAGFTEVDPVTTRWTFGAHEPFTMYRRVGRICTGAVEGNAEWVKPWLDWFDEHSPEVMERFGFNFLHARFYKGMGWEVEKKDFPNVQKLVQNCHRHGVRALAYVQFGTLYPEAMKREIDDIASWAGYDLDGRVNTYGGQYFRWMPCLNSAEWEAYLKRMCTIALTEGGFDGIMFDNVFDVPCYCARCEKLFRAHLAKIADPVPRFGFDHLGDMLLPRIPKAALAKREVKDPVEQEWLRWRADTMTALMMRLRSHIKSVKPDAIVSGNPSPYRNRAGALAKAQNMAELCQAFDFIIMQNDNYPEVLANGEIHNRVRDMKFAQDIGQRIVPLCDDVEHMFSDREAKFLMPMIEEIVFGAIPTDRTTIFPVPDEGFLRRDVVERRLPEHRRFNAFAAAHREELAAPTIHSVRIFYPEREVYLSEKVHQGVTAAEEIFIRNHVPYGYLVSTPEKPLELPQGTEVVVVPGLTALSDAQVAALADFARRGGRLVVTGDAGRYDEWNAQRRINPLLPQLKGLANVVMRKSPDLIANAVMGWGYKVPPPSDGGRMLMADLAKVGWKAPVEFENMPPHVLAEYRRLASGELVVHLVNLEPFKPVKGAKIVKGGAGKIVFEEPLAEKAARCELTEGATLPAFAYYAILKVSR